MHFLGGNSCFTIDPFLHIWVWPIFHFISNWSPPLKMDFFWGCYSLHLTNDPFFKFDFFLFCISFISEKHLRLIIGFKNAWVLLYFFLNSFDLNYGYFILTTLFNLKIQDT